LPVLQVVKTTFGSCKFQDLRKSFCNESGLKKDNNKLQHCACEKNPCEEFSGGQQEISQWVFASRKMSGRRTLCSRQAL
jgi:hypothetical protein